MKNAFTISSFIIFCLSIFSCKTQYLFESEQQGNLNELMITDTIAYENTIKTDDKVSLSIWNHDDMSIGSVFSIYNSNEAYGKWVLVDANGFVTLPKIGRVALRGQTCSAAADTLTKLYAKYLVSPVIVVKVLNREVTILGEIRTPGTYTLEKESNTLIEIIGKAQGFERYANFKKVQLIRNGISYNIDMTKLTKDMIHSIIVESGDVINIPSKRGKGLDQKAPTLIPFASALTAIVVALSLIL